MTNTVQKPWLTGRGELDKLALASSNGASAEIYRHGAHLTSWCTATGREWIFTSKQAEFAPGKAIRGGIPIIFPQFNAFGSGPRHGFARNRPWQLQQAPTADDGHNRCVLFLSSNEQTKTAWNYEFTITSSMELSDQQLRVSLQVTNTDDKPFQFTAALHTYFAVDHFLEAKLQGLEGLSYWDNDGTDFQRRQTARSNELAFDGPIDRIYFNARQPLTLIDGEQQLHIASEGFKDVVVWNPGASSAQKMADMADNEWQKMLCIEAATIDQPIILTPGESWQASQILTA